MQYTRMSSQTICFATFAQLTDTGVIDAGLVTLCHIQSIESLCTGQRY